MQKIMCLSRWKICIDYVAHCLVEKPILLEKRNMSHSMNPIKPTNKLSDQMEDFIREVVHKQIQSGLFIWLWIFNRWRDQKPVVYIQTKIKHLINFVNNGSRCSIEWIKPPIQSVLLLPIGIQCFSRSAFINTALMVNRITS